jgi:hypothetical protein
MFGLKKHQNEFILIHRYNLRKIIHQAHPHIYSPGEDFFSNSKTSTKKNLHRLWMSDLNKLHHNG